MSNLLIQNMDLNIYQGSELISLFEMVLEYIDRRLLSDVRQRISRRREDIKSIQKIQVISAIINFYYILQKT